ncbi:nuclear transport factor 2 family protein [Streptomyces sp. NPDC001493]
MAITELISLHGHLVDDGSLDRLEELFTADVVYDLTDFGQEPLRGVAAIREAAWALGAANPVAHHVTNVVLAASADGHPAVPSPTTTPSCAPLTAGGSATANCRHAELPWAG